MKTQTRTHFYNEIKFFCNAFSFLDLPSKFIKAAKSKKEEKLIQAFEEFKGENSELWKRMSEFYDAYSRIRRPQIFYGEYTGEGKEEGLLKYDPKEIEPVSLCFLFVFGNGAIDDDDLFKNPLDFVVEIEKVQPKLGRFISESYLNSLSSLRRALN